MEQCGLYYAIGTTLNPLITQALHDWPFAVWLRSAPLVYPTLEAIHIIAIAITFGSLWIVDLRLLGVRLFGLSSINVNVLAKATLHGRYSASHLPLPSAV